MRYTSEARRQQLHQFLTLVSSAGCGGEVGGREGVLLLPAGGGVGVGSDRVQQPFLLSPELSGLSESLFCRMGGNDSIPFCGLGGF